MSWFFVVTAERTKTSSSSNILMHLLFKVPLQIHGTRMYHLWLLMFSREWEFAHITSSPYHSQANGKAESAVKIAKRLIKKAKRDNQDLYLAVLNWKNTPSKGVHSSPVQKLQSRRTRTQLPTRTELLQPEVATKVTSDIEYRRQKAKAYYDKGAHELSALYGTHAAT